MKVYVCGSSGELARAEEVIRLLRKAGVVVTMDWPAAVRSARLRGATSDADLTEAEAAEQAEADEHAIAAADFVLFLAPSTITRGAWWEFGYAVGVRVPVVLSRGQRTARGSIFEMRATVVHHDDAAAIAWLVRQREDLAHT